MTCRSCGCGERTLLGDSFAVLPAASDGVAERANDQLTQEIVLALEQHGAQLSRTVKVFASGKRARGVHRLAVGQRVAPAAHPVEVFEAQPDRVH